MDSGIESTESSNGSVSDICINMADFQADELQPHPASDNLNEGENIQNFMFREPSNLPSMRLRRPKNISDSANAYTVKDSNADSMSSSLIFPSENTLPNCLPSERLKCHNDANYTSNFDYESAKSEGDLKDKEKFPDSGSQIPRIGLVLRDLPDPEFQINLSDLAVPDGCCLKLNFPKIESVTGFQEQATPFETLSCTAYENGPLQITTNHGPYTGSLAVLPYESRELQRKFKHYRRRLRQIISTKPKEKKIRMAASLNNVELVERLLKEGVNPKATDEKQRTALHIAASKGYTKIVRLLLQNNADPNQKDSIGNTALHLAACTSHIDTVTLLLKAGTDVKQADNQGFSPLHLANSRLKFLQKDLNPSSENLRAQVYEIVEMMQEYMKSSGNTEDAELLSALTNQLSLSDSKTTQGENDFKQLLTSLQDLTLSKTKKN